MAADKINIYIFVANLIGLALSCYALYIELKLEKDAGYQAYCDIHEFFSCTKAFASEYAKGFGGVGQDSILHLPNSVYGLVAYVIMIFTSFCNSKTVVMFQIISVVTSNILSLYLIYILIFVLFDICIVCFGIHMVNALNLYLIYLKWTTVLKKIE